MWNPPPDHPLRRLFAGVTEVTFQTQLGVADPNLIDYLSALLSRFVHVDVLHRLRNAAGRRLDQVADMVAEAVDLPPEGRTAREMHRHIGDFALFWTGVYPEALASAAVRRLQGLLRGLLCPGQAVLLHRQHVRGRTVSGGGAGSATAERGIRVVCIWIARSSARMGKKPARIEFFCRPAHPIKKAGGIIR